MLYNETVDFANSHWHFPFILDGKLELLNLGWLVVIDTLVYFDYEGSLDEWLRDRYLYLERSAFSQVNAMFSSALTRSPPWGAAMTMWWTLCLSVSSTPKSRERRSAMRRGGSSSGRRSSLLGTIQVRTTWPPISFTNRLCEGWNLGSTGVTRYVTSAATGLVQHVSSIWWNRFHWRGWEIFLPGHMIAWGLWYLLGNQILLAGNGLDASTCCMSIPSWWILDGRVNGHFIYQPRFGG